MDFNDTAQEADFREEVKTWLKDNVPSEAELTGLDYMGGQNFGKSANTMPVGPVSVGRKSTVAEGRARLSR